MPTPDPSANGDPPKTDDFEMRLEPVDPAELNLNEVPTVEAVALRRPGFAFWKAPLWCLLFLALTQAAPALVLGGAFILISYPKVNQQLQEEDREKGHDGGTTKPSTDRVVQEIVRLLLSAESRRLLQIATVAAPLCGIAFSLFLMPRTVGRDWRRRVGVRVPHIEHVVLCMLLVLPLLIFNMTLEGLISKATDGWDFLGLKAVMESMKSWPWWVLVLGISIGPAISEELFCRGFLGQALVSRYGIWLGVIGTSFLFGALHIHPIQVIIASLLGVALHLVYIASRSILIPILLHLLHNFIAISADAKDIPLPIGVSLEHALQYQPVLMLFASAFLAGAVGFAFYQCRVRIWTPQGMPSLKSNYPHVELPNSSSPNRAVPGPISALALGLLVVAACFFSAVWFGL